MRILQINSIANSGSTGRISENIGLVLKEANFESYMAYGRTSPKSNLNTIKIGTTLDNYTHGIKTLLTDKHGFGSKSATRKFLQEVDRLKPDAIGLHNLHGYYINIELLFEYIKKQDIPVLWTLFDCWAFTGHCSYFDDIDCEKWKVKCQDCPKYRMYPSSFTDSSAYNYQKKKELFTGVPKMELITHSKWLAGMVKNSFLNKYKINVTPSAVDLDTFKPTESRHAITYNLEGKRVILGCASPWSGRKGLNDFIELSEFLPPDYKIVLIGLDQKQMKQLPPNIFGIERTESIQELAEWYSLADVFVNPTSQDNFPTTNLEALACGTPVVTYDTGGSPEAVDSNTGKVVKKGNVKGLFEAIQQVLNMDLEETSQYCRKRAEKLYDKDTRYLDYLNMYEGILKS